MREVFCGFLLAVLPTARLAAQNAPSTATVSAGVPQAVLDLQQPIKPLSIFAGSPKPTSEMDASLFLPQNLVANPASALPDETRTPAQLEALLEAYVGTWRGESLWYSTATQRSVRAATEQICKMEKENGRNVLNCIIVYQLGGAESVAFARLWVEDGCIMSEVAQHGERRKYVAQSHEVGLVWRSFGSMDTLLEFGETETLRLTADGGQISSQGFEVQHDALGASIILESTELKLVK